MKPYEYKVIITMGTRADGSIVNLYAARMKGRKGHFRIIGKSEDGEEDFNIVTRKFVCVRDSIDWCREHAETTIEGFRFIGYHNLKGEQILIADATDRAGQPVKMYIEQTGEERWQVVVIFADNVENRLWRDFYSVSEAQRWLKDHGETGGGLKIVDVDYKTV